MKSTEYRKNEKNEIYLSEMRINHKISHKSTHFVESKKSREK